MSQHDFIIENQFFPQTRADINAALQAIASNSSGDTEPGTTYANQWWYETDTNILKLRNEDNNDWVDVITLDASMTATASELNQLDAITRGSILYGNASGDTARLAKGGAGTVLTSDGTDISWAAGGGGGGTEFIASSGAISSAATVDFTQFDSSAYDSYAFHFIDVLPATDGSRLQAQTSPDTSSHVYDTGSSDYILTLGATGTSNVGRLLDTSSIGGLVNEGANITVAVLNPHTSTHTKVVVTDGVITLTNAVSYGAPALARGFVRLAAAQVNAIRFSFNFGNVASGEITMYGIKNS